MTERVQRWPMNPANGHDLSWYEQNNFGSYKSYHVFGQLAEFFGGYWQDEDFGMARILPITRTSRAEKSGFGGFTRRHDLGKPADRYRWPICRNPVRPAL